jgi:hypothetical protein
MVERFDCPSCGAPLDYDGSGYPSMRCPFCNNTVVVPEALRVRRPAAPPPCAAPPSPAQAGGAGFRVTVEDVFFIKGQGTVATGRIESGTVRIGNRVRITRADGSGKTATVTAVESFRKMLTEAKAGDNVGLAMKELDKSDLRRGDVLEGD